MVVHEGVVVVNESSMGDSRASAAVVVCYEAISLEYCVIGARKPEASVVGDFGVQSSAACSKVEKMLAGI